MTARLAPCTSTGNTSRGRHGVQQSAKLESATGPTKPIAKPSSSLPTVASSSAGRGPGCSRKHAKAGLFRYLAIYPIFNLVVFAHINWLQALSSSGAFVMSYV